jgi:hypothetical protein
LHKDNGSNTATRTGLQPDKISYRKSRVSLSRKYVIAALHSKQFEILQSVVCFVCKVPCSLCYNEVLPRVHRCLPCSHMPMRDYSKSSAQATARRSNNARRFLNRPLSIPSVSSPQQKQYSQNRSCSRYAALASWLRMLASFCFEAFRCLYGGLHDQ